MIRLQRTRSGELERELGLGWRSGWRDLRHLGRQANVVKVASRFGRIGDERNELEPAPAIAAINLAAKHSPQQLSPRDPPWARRRDLRSLLAEGRLIGCGRCRFPALRSHRESHFLL